MDKPIKAHEKGYSSVSDMLKAVGAAKDTISAVEEVEQQETTNALVKMRVSRGYTQADIARKLKCSQGRISKIESGKDVDLRLSDLVDYSRATGVPLQILIGPRNHAHAIKHHVFAMKHHLDALVKLAHEDKGEIARGIDKFFEEVVFNVGIRLGECQMKLKGKKKPVYEAVPDFEILPATEIPETAGV
jgi:transcriptional regulator with XRE-family HTH domain